MSKAIVLLSGGQDSTTCLYWAKQNFDEVVALNVFYGQRHASEIKAAEAIAKLAGVQLRGPIDMKSPLSLVESDLTKIGTVIHASGGHVDHQMPEGLPTSFVPGRNGYFLMAAAGVAVELGAHDIVTGVCQTDSSGYPDCRDSSIRAMENYWKEAMPSSALPLRILTPLMWINKAETVRLAKRLPGCWDALALSQTCYEGERPACGVCPACTLRLRGFNEAGEVDPVPYAALPAVESDVPF